MKRGKQPKFGREHVQREALMKALATALIEHGKIKTTVAKARAVTSYIAKLITQAKKRDLAARRMLLRNLGAKATNKLTTEIATDLKDRSGGYTRTLILGQRRSDGAPMAQVEFVK